MDQNGQRKIRLIQDVYEYDDSSDNTNENQEKTNTHPIKIHIDDPNSQYFLISDVPKDITVKEFSKLIISSSEIPSKNECFSIFEDDKLLFDDDFIRCDNIKLVYMDNNDDDDIFPFFLFFHILLIIIYFANNCPIQFNILVSLKFYLVQKKIPQIYSLFYCIFTFIFAIYLYIKKKSLIDQARIIWRKIMTCVKLLFLFFYSMLPFFNADNLD